MQPDCRAVSVYTKRRVFHTLIEGLVWDETIHRWRIDYRSRRRHSCAACHHGGGPLNKPKLPGIKGIREFKGKLFHTARWDYDYTGGGWRSRNSPACRTRRWPYSAPVPRAIQAIPHLARHAKQLYVIQRTPSTVDVRPNPPTILNGIRRRSRAGRRSGRRTSSTAQSKVFGPDEPDMICDIWTEIIRNLRLNSCERGLPDSNEDSWPSAR